MEEEDVEEDEARKDYENVLTLPEQAHKPVYLCTYVAVDGPIRRSCCGLRLETQDPRYGELKRTTSMNIIELSRKRPAVLSHLYERCSYVRTASTIMLPARVSFISRRCASDPYTPYPSSWIWFVGPRL